MLLDALFEGQRMMPKTLIIRICDEETENNDSWLRCRMVIETRYHSGDQGSHFQTFDELILEGESIEPWKESIEQWWDESGRSRYGLEKYVSTP